jgi:mannose-6-phosphate isomerase-like protein (cupin superfamily)
MKVLCIGLASIYALMAGDPLALRIGRYEESKLAVHQAVHQGAGELHYELLLGQDAIHNLNFMHRGIIMPKSGIGHHFHNASEEMFIVWGGQAEFTIDGHTSLLRGPVGAPLRAGHSHAVYNPGNVPLQWMNINVRLGAAAPGRGSAGNTGGAPSFSADPTATFNLGDDRAHALLDLIPVFQYTTFYRETLPSPPGTAANKANEAALSLGVSTVRLVPGMNGGHGNVLYQRCLGPSTYTGPWAFMDHYIVPPGATIGRHKHEGVDEIWYVMNGEAAVTVDGETAHLGAYDAVPIRAKQAHAFENAGTQDLEFMVVGVALQKGVLDSEDLGK